MITQDRRKQVLTALSVAFFCTLIVFGIRTLAHDLFSDWENKTIDYRFKLRGKRPVDPSIVLIDIDEKSIAAIGRWPWDRGIHAEMIDILSESQSKVIGYDILFKQASVGLGEAGDKALIASIQKAGNVILPTGFELADSGDDSLLRVLREVGPFPALREVAAGIGHISSNRDSDGVIRRLPLFVDNNGSRFPSFSMAMLSDSFPPSIKKTIPVDGQGMMLINYAGRWVETFDHYPFVDILKAGRNNEEHQELKDALQGKIVIISNTATGYDLKPVPLEADYPGGGVHANALNTILSKNPLQETTGFTSAAFALLLSIILAVITSRKSGLYSLMVFFVLLVVHLSASQFIFSKGIVTPILFPVLAMTLTYLSALVHQNRIARHHADQLAKEKESVTRSLRIVSEKLHENEYQLDSARHSFSSLKDDLSEITGREREKFARIEVLKLKMAKLMTEHDSLERKKRVLDRKLADALPAEIDRDPPPSALASEFENCGIVTQNREMLRRFDRAKRFSREGRPILILGETGTGKELFAKAIHQMSERSSKPLVTVNIPVLGKDLIESELFGHVKGAFTGAQADKKGLFHEADEGTIFLDEIGEMQPQLQAKLLRVLQEGEVKRLGSIKTERLNVRVIAATHQDLKEKVRQSTFREDLFYRLNVLTITILPLRERPEDIEMLAKYFLKKNGEEPGRTIKHLSKGAMEALKQHHWPGNVRELENAIDRGVALSDGDQIPEKALELDGSPEHENENDLSDAIFLDLLRKNRFSISDTSDQLKVKRLTVSSRLKGIALKLLDEKDERFEAVAETLSGGEGETQKIQERIEKYHQNLIESIRGYQNSEEAIAILKDRGLLRNVKKKYHPGIEGLIKRYFEGL